MMDAFSRRHPAVCFAFFSAVLIFTMLYLHPVLLGISLAASASYLGILRGGKRLIKTFAALLPFVLLMSLINALVNHAGVTPLLYLSNGNAVTLEALCYGLLASVMFASVILWFSCFNDIMSADKLLFLFGRLSPSLSLLLSTALRFVPRFAEKLKSIARSRAQLGFGTSEGSFSEKLKNSVSVLSACISWSLEGGITAADSMKSRGCGAARRTSYSVWRFERRDGAALALCAVFSSLLIASVVSGALYARCYPSIAFNGGGFLPCLGEAAFAALCFLPHVIDFKEACAWRRSISAI